MRVTVNDYRGRNPQHDLDGMIHRVGCGHPLRYAPLRPEWWPEFESLEEAMAEFQNPRVCRGCLEGMGPHLER